MTSGTVKNFNYDVGYGFAVCDDGRDVYIHKSDTPRAIELATGDRISFRLEENPQRPAGRNLKAREVKLI